MTVWLTPLDLLWLDERGLLEKVATPTDMIIVRLIHSEGSTDKIAELSLTAQTFLVAQTMNQSSL